MYVEAQKAQLASDANGVKWDDPDIAKSLDLITEYYGAENSQKAEDVKKEISEHNVQTLEEIKRENGEIFDSYLSDTKKNLEDGTDGYHPEGMSGALDKIDSAMRNQDVSGQEVAPEAAAQRNSRQGLADEGVSAQPREGINGLKTAAENSTAKAEPTMGEAGAKALADISKTNPGLAGEGMGHTDLVDAYNAGVKGEDLSRDTRDNAAVGNYTDSVEAMYNAGQADAKTGSASAESSQGVENGARLAETANGAQTTETAVESSQGVENGARPTETANGAQPAETAETNPSTEQSGTDTTPKSGSGISPELEAKLAALKLSLEERTAAEEYARTRKDSAISNDFDRDTVKRIMAAAEIIKEYNGKNGIDSRQGEGYNKAKNTEDTDVKNLRFESWNDFSEYAQNIGKNTALTLEEKVSKIQQAFERIADQTDINIPIDAKYLIGFSKEGEVVYDWPLYLGFDLKEKVFSITRDNMLPETADRYGPMTGSNFSDIPKEGKYTRNQRSTPYVVNEKAYHVVNFNNETYFEKIDAIRAGDMNALNEILESEGISPISEYFFDRLKQKYNDFIEKVAREMGASVDATYGLKGTVAAWKDLKGGAGQIITPITGKMLIDLGIII